jgi:hypothetical protein
LGQLFFSLRLEHRAAHLQEQLLIGIPLRITPEIEGSAYWNPVIEARHISMVGPARANS